MKQKPIPKFVLIPIYVLATMILHPVLFYKLIKHGQWHWFLKTCWWKYLKACVEIERENK